MSYLIGLDMGGTEIKAAAAHANEAPLNKPLSFPSYSHKPKDEIIQHIGDIIQQLTKDTPPLAIGFSFPGPFDYSIGISLIKGLAKYESLYGYNIDTLIKSNSGILKKLPFIKNIPMFFVNDVTAFALGVSLDNKCKKALCVCIGTGCGSAFLEDGKVVTNGRGIPENGWIYNLPFKDSCLDDYLSKRGLEKITTSIMGKPFDGKTLAFSLGDKKAAACFAQFGQNLAEGLLPILDEFNPSAVVLGGQIMNSFGQFNQPLKQICNQKGIDLLVYPNTSQLAIAGLWAEAKRREIF